MRFLGNMSGYAKTVIVLAAVLSVSCGLCAVTNSATSSQHGWWNMRGTEGNFWAFASLTEAAVLVLSFFGIVLVLIAWAIHAFIVRPKRT